MARKRITICLMCVVVGLAICSTVRAEEAKGPDAKGNSVAENAFREAIADLTKAIELDPSNSVHWCERGGVYLNMQQWDKAIADYSKAIELQPEDWWYWHERGFAYMQLGQWNKVVADYSKAIELKPKAADCYGRRAIAYQQLGRWDEAIADLTKAIEVDPSNSDKWHGRAETYWKMKQWDKALADFSKAIELNPSNSVHWCERGGAYLNMQQWDKAIADYSKAIERQPEDWWYWHERGYAYMQLDQWEKVIADYSRAIELEPKAADCYGRRAIAYQQLGQWDEAIVDLTKAIELEPENDHYRKQRNEAKIPAPGYRPESDHSGAFLSSIGSCQMVVFPTVVRRKSTSNDGPIMSSNKASQQAIFKHLTKKNIAETNACMTELDLNWIGGESQWEFFQSSMKLMAEQVKQSNLETDYHLAMEVIIVPRPNGRLAVFGIHVYILDQAGHNAFSFLLNSHHQLFIRAELHTEDSSKESIEKLIADSTQVVLKALEQQIQLAN